MQIKPTWHKPSAQEISLAERPGADLALARISLAGLKPPKTLHAISVAAEG
jgi:hypothetical protein